MKVTAEEYRTKFIYFNKTVTGTANTTVIHPTGISANTGTPHVLEIVGIKYLFSQLEDADIAVPWSLDVQVAQGRHTTILSDQASHIDVIRISNAFAANVQGNVVTNLVTKFWWQPPPGTLVWQDDISVRIGCEALSTSSGVNVWIYYRDLPISIEQLLLLRRLV